MGGGGVGTGKGTGKSMRKLCRNYALANYPLVTLKTLTSLNKEVRLFFLGDNSIWSFPSVFPLAITVFGGPGGYFSLAIIAFGAFQLIFPDFYYRLGKTEIKESSFLV